MAEVRLRLKYGALELEVEGPEQFFEARLIPTLEGVLKLELPDVVPSSGLDGVAAPLAAGGGPVSSDSRSRYSTTDFAVKMGAKSGSDLVMAAAASLHHTKGQEEFRRAELLAEMKGAKAFYRASYGGNLTKSLDMLVKSNRLQSPRSDVFALPYSEIETTRRLLPT